MGKKERYYKSQRLRPGCTIITRTQTANMRQSQATVSLRQSQETVSLRQSQETVRQCQQTDKMRHAKSEQDQKCDV